MTDYSDLIQQSVSAAPVQAAATIDDNPDKAARSLDLSASTGVPAPAIYGDLDGFQKQHKMQMAMGIIRDNPQLQTYVNSHPLAAAVSNDDYGNLDKFSTGAGLTKRLMDVVQAPRRVLDSTFSGAAEGVKEGYGDGLLGQQLYNEIPALRNSVAAQMIAQPIEFLARGVSAIGSGIEGAARGASEAAVTAATGDPMQGQRAGRDLGALTSYEMTKPEMHMAPEIMAAKPWLESGQEPPAGVHPAIDSAKAKINAGLLDRLDEDLANAQSALTKDRSPELFQNFVEQHYGDAEIGIHGDAVAKLYGDKLPTPDDGMLGWIPGIEEKLALAKETGADVHVPVKDWIGNVDPKLASDLHDDIRMWPGGITKTEAAVPTEPTPMVDAPIAQVRGAASLEPMFSIGDRKLELKQLPSIGGSEDFHEFAFQDQNGKDVGSVTILPDPAKKQLYVANINGLAGLYSNAFGPSLVRDLKRQLKELYPDYETITGHRVSGAREKAGTWDDDNIAHPVVRLHVNDIPADDNLRNILGDAYMHDMGMNVSARILPKEFWEPHEVALDNQTQQDIARITGGTAEVIGTHDIAYPGQPTGSIRGTYINRPGFVPRILTDLFDPNSPGIARHEAIHHLYRQGFFKPEEWSALTSAAEAEGWIKRYKIDKAYADLPKHLQIEEAIAEAYRDWYNTKDSVNHPQTLVTQAFQKLAELWEGLKAKMRELLGRDPTPEELFGKVESGEIGARQADGGESGLAFSKTEADARFDSLRAEATGLDLQSYKRIQKLIQDRHAEDVAAATARAEKEQARTQTKEWKDNEAAMRVQVEETIRQRPDVAADLFIGSGELNGEKLRQRYTLAESDLSPEQKAALPEHYVSKNGLPVDSVANMFGYSSGDMLVQKLAEYNAAKGDLSPKEMLKQVVKDETARQMQAKYGDLKTNIMDEAKDQALSETNLNLLAEEMHAAGLKAGIATINKDVAKAWVQEQFGKMEIGSVSSDRFMDSIGKHGRDAERALLAGKPADALQSMQKKYLNALLAAEARKLEKAMGTFDKVAKQMSARVVKSMDPEYTNFVHQILMQIGKPVRRSVQDLAENIAAGDAKDLKAFVEQKTASLRELPVYPELYDQGWRKNYPALTVEEFRAVSDSIKSLVYNGRDELKINRAGEAVDFAGVKSELIANLKEFKQLTYDTKGDRSSIAPKFVSKRYRYYTAAHMQIETIFNRWDKFNEKGAWNQSTMRDLIDGANQEDAWRKEYADKLTGMKYDGDMKRTVDNPLFRDPNSGALMKFNRENLITVMMNTGTDSNMVKMARGYKLDPKDMMNWVHQHATKADWDFVQGVWDNIFKDIKAKSDTMYRSLTGGVSAENIPPREIQTPHGTYAGGYYPIIFHPEFEGKSKTLMGKDVLEGENFVRATTPAGYTKGRTGYTAQLSLDLDAMPGRVAQMLHDVAMRPAVLNASKVFYDADIRKAISAHYGNEYRDLLIPYLRDVANAAGFNSKGQKAFAKTSEFIRQNMVSTLVGLNPGTVMKHGPTALMQSIQEVGPVAFGKAVANLFSKDEVTGETNWQFAMTNSLELQRRHQNYEETLSGARAQLVPDGKFMSLRQTVLKYASMPVALSDIASAVPTWLAQYEKASLAGENHGDAIYSADRAVRRAHGSTAVTNRPAIMRDASPWLTSVYTFFNHIMNRQAELVWKSGDALGMVKDGDYAKAMGKVPELSAMLFAYVLAPALIEELVTPQTNKEGESWGMKAAKGLGFTLGASWIGVRDVASAIINGRDPSVGIYSTAGATITNLARDFGKNQPLSKDHAGRVIQDASALLGLGTGMMPEQVGRAARFGHDVATGQQHPKGPWGWVVGSRYGTLDKHSSTFGNYMAGKAY